MLIQGFVADKSLDGLYQYTEDKKYGLDFTLDAKESVDVLVKEDIFGYLWVKCFKRSIIEEHGIRFNEDTRFLEDEEFVIKFLSHTKKVVSTSDVGYHYHVPNWTAKYKMDFAIYQQLFQMAKEFQFKSLQTKYGKYVCEALTNDYADITWSERIEVLKTLKRLFKDAQDCCSIHSISKKVIFKCPFVGASAIFYFLHCKIKEYSQAKHTES